MVVAPHIPAVQNPAHPFSAAYEPLPKDLAGLLLRCNVLPSKLRPHHESRTCLYVTSRRCRGDGQKRRGARVQQCSGEVSVHDISPQHSRVTVDVRIGTHCGIHVMGRVPREQTTILDFSGHKAVTLTATTTPKPLRLSIQMTRAKLDCTVTGDPPPHLRLDVL